MRSSLLTLATALAALTVGAKAAQLPLMNQNQQSNTGGLASSPNVPVPGSSIDPNTDLPHTAGFTRAVLEARRKASIQAPEHIGVGSGSVANLADTLTLERRAGLWWDYARDISAVTTRLLASGATRSTLFVPVDTAIYKMSRKPHQNADGTPATDEQALANVERFISAHIVPNNVDMPTTSPAQTLLDGLSIQVERDGDNWKITPGDIAVVGVKEASNGRILYLDSVIDY